MCFFHPTLPAPYTDDNGGGGGGGGEVLCQLLMTQSLVQSCVNFWWLHKFPWCFPLQKLDNAIMASVMYVITAPLFHRVFSAFFDHYSLSPSKRLLLGVSISFSTTWIPVTQTASANYSTTTAFLSSSWGGGNSSVVRALNSWLKGRGFESLQEWWEDILLQGQLSVLTLISVSVPPPC